MSMWNENVAVRSSGSVRWSWLEAMVSPDRNSWTSSWSGARPALCYDLCAREEADAVLAILVKVAES